jgi:uncharacterized protein YbaP (TraB family)
MRHLIKNTALLLSAILGLTSLAERPALAEAPIQTPSVPKPALWKVADADTTIYLFGTIHALPVSVQWLNGPVEQALAASDQLVTELPDTPPEEMQAAVASNAMLPAGKTLRALLSPAQKAKYEAALASFGAQPQAYDSVEPWFAAIALTSLPLLRDGYTAENGVEEKIAERAKALGKPRTGLETAAYQLHMFDSLPMEVQKNYLMEVIDGLPTIDKDLAAIIEQWKVGNAEKLADLLNDKDDDPRMTAALLTGRNKVWTQWVKTRLDQPGTVFMAVGAGHLAGKDSVQEMLARSGVTVTRVQ